MSTHDVNCPPPPKCAKLAQDATTENGVKNNGDTSESSALSLLRTLRPSRILNNRNHDKFLALLASHPAETEGIVLLEKTPFPADVSVFGEDWVEDGDEVMRNDVYSKLTVKASKGMGDLKATIIHPCTAALVNKYERQTIHLLTETPELYEKVVWPYIEKTRHSLNWVYNILNGTAEQDRIILSDPDPDTGFVLSVDLKWDGISTEDMYCLALVRRTDLTSVRDLGPAHLPLLRNIGTKGREALAKKLGIAETELRVYLHYPPSFYHLHIHFTHVSNAVAGAETERALLLDTVINNIEMMPEYYKKATLTLGVREKDKLFALMNEK